MTPINNVMNVCQSATEKDVCLAPLALTEYAILEHLVLELVFAIWDGKVYPPFRSSL